MITPTYPIQLVKSGFTLGTYIVHQDKLVTHNAEADSTLLSHYRSMYVDRIRTKNRSQRVQGIIQFPPIFFTGLRSGTVELLSKSKCTTVLPVFSIHKSGVASASLWISKYPQLPLTNIFQLRNIDSLSTETELSFKVNDNTIFMCKGSSILLDDIVSFYALFIMNMILPDFISLSAISNQHANGVSYKKILFDFLSYSKLHQTGFPYTESYSIFHIDKTRDRRFGAPQLETFLLTYSRELRGIITGDKNWDKKKDEIVKKIIPLGDLSSRRSLAWFVEAEGALKIYSNDMETDLRKSKVLIAFEVEFLRTMRFLLEKIVFNLDHVSDKSISPKDIAMFRDSEFRRMNDYYNLDMCQKDTTAERIEHGTSRMNIDFLLVIAKQKFENIMFVINAKYNELSSHRQRLLSLIFGVFAAGKLTYDITSNYCKIKTNDDLYTFLINISSTTVVMALVFVIVLYISDSGVKR